MSKSGIHEATALRAMATPYQLRAIEQLDRMMIAYRVFKIALPKEMLRILDSCEVHDEGSKPIFRPLENGKLRLRSALELTYGRGEPSSRLGFFALGLFFHDSILVEGRSVC